MVYSQEYDNGNTKSMCLPKEIPMSILNDSSGPMMNFCSARVRSMKDFENQRNKMKRCNLKRCYVASLNVRTLRIRRIVKNGKLHCVNEHKMEHYKETMITCGLYVFAMSEVRRDGSGEEDVGDGFAFIWQGNCDDGSKGGVGFLLSPDAAKAWRKGGSVSKSSEIGRILALSFALGGGEGKLLWPH